MVAFLVRNSFSFQIHSAVWKENKFNEIFKIKIMYLFALKKFCSISTNTQSQAYFDGLPFPNCTPLICKWAVLNRKLRANGLHKKGHLISFLPKWAPRSSILYSTFFDDGLPWIFLKKVCERNRNYYSKV